MKKKKQRSFATGIVIGALTVCGLGLLVYFLSSQERSQNIKQKALSLKDKTQAKFKDKSENLKGKAGEIKLHADHWKDETHNGDGPMGLVKAKFELLKQAVLAGKEAALEKKAELATQEEL